MTVPSKPQPGGVRPVNPFAGSTQATLDQIKASNANEAGIINSRRRMAAALLVQDGGLAARQVREAWEAVRGFIHAPQAVEPSTIPPTPVVPLPVPDVATVAGPQASASGPGAPPADASGFLPGALYIDTAAGQLYQLSGATQPLVGHGPPPAGATGLYWLDLDTLTLYGTAA